MSVALIKYWGYYHSSKLFWKYQNNTPNILSDLIMHFLTLPCRINMLEKGKAPADQWCTIPLNFKRPLFPMG